MTKFLNNSIIARKVAGLPQIIFVFGGEYAKYDC
jgi:hypothetical protein